MSRPYVHPWDEPTDDPVDTMVRSTPRQVFDGQRVGVANQTVECSCCQGLRRSGQRLVCYAYRPAEAPEWLVTRCYCPACAPTAIETPTLGTAELLVEAELGVVSIVAEQLHECCLLQVTVRDVSPCTEGAEP